MKYKFLKMVLSLFAITAIGTTLVSCGDENKEPETPPATQNEEKTNIDPPKELESYEVKFDTDGGNSINAVTVNKDSKVGAPSNPKKPGKVFAGWYLDDQVFDFNTPITKNITIKAKWEGTGVDLGGIIENETTNNQGFTYRDSYFDTASNVFNKDLALFLYGASASSDGTEASATYFNELGFEKATVYPKAQADYRGIYYTIAEKSLNNNFKLIVVAVRGIGYGAEWGSNLEIGSEGEHYGFKFASDMVFKGLKEYILSINYAGNYKIALTGYSRAGAVANILADSLLKSEQKLTANENIYAYTFEAPKGLLEASAVKYDNVFNVINEADLITYVAPEQYGFARCGTDINIYNENIDTLLKNYNDKLVLPQFTTQENYDNEKTLGLYVLESLIGFDAEADYSLKTRADYCANYQSSLKYVIELFFNMPKETLNKIIDDIKNKMSNDAFSLFGLITSGDELNNYLKGFLDTENIQYDETQLLASCNKLVGFIQGPGAALLAFVVEPNRSNLIRTIDMHFTVVNYVLLANYSK